MNFLKKKATISENAKTGTRKCIICQTTTMENDKPVCETCMTKIKRSSQMPEEFKLLLNRMNDNDFGQVHYNSVDIANLYHGMEKVDDIINNLDDMTQKYVSATVKLNDTRTNFAEYRTKTEDELAELRLEVKKKNRFKQTFKKVKKSIHDFFDV